MTDVMGCFVKPELLLNVSGKKICKIDLEADASLGRRTCSLTFRRSIYSKNAADRTRRQQISLIKSKKLTTGMYLQKMPINNILLKHLSALDPAVRGHSPAMQYMKALPRRQSEAKKKTGVGPKRSHHPGLFGSRRIWCSRSLAKGEWVCTTPTAKPTDTIL